jgi:hypothetical protein
MGSPETSKYCRWEGRGDWRIGLLGFWGALGRFGHFEDLGRVKG